MKVSFSPFAQKQVEEILDYIEERNTEGSDVRWLAKFTAFVYSYAKPNASYALCKHPSLSRYNYQCITYGDWVIAFRVKGNMFEVRRVVYGPRLA